MSLCDANDGSIFSGLQDAFEVKKKYAKLYKEINSEMEKINDNRRAKSLQKTLKYVRKMINSLCLYIKQHTPKENGLKHSMKSNTLPSKVNNLVDHKWIKDARKLAQHQSRTSFESRQVKQRRLEVEQRDGIISMPLLEPYLDLKWPNSFPNINSYTHPVLKEYSRALREKEDKLNSTKLFGL